MDASNLTSCFAPRAPFRATNRRCKPDNPSGLNRFFSSTPSTPLLALLRISSALFLQTRLVKPHTQRERERKCRSNNNLALLLHHTSPRYPLSKRLIFQIRPVLFPVYWLRSQSRSSWCEGPHLTLSSSRCGGRASECTLHRGFLDGHTHTQGTHGRGRREIRKEPRLASAVPYQGQTLQEFSPAWNAGALGRSRAPTRMSSSPCSLGLSSPPS